MPAMVAPRPVHWVDSGDAIARRVLTLLSGPADGPDRGFRALFIGAAGSEVLHPALLALGCREIAVLP